MAKTPSTSKPVTRTTPPAKRAEASNSANPPPSHLSRDAKKWWRQVTDDFDLEPHHLRLLQVAGEAWDRAQEARKVLKKHGGVTFIGANGEPKAHPAVAIERDARTAFARLVRELDLDGDGPSDRSRPPAIRSNRG